MNGLRIVAETIAGLTAVLFLLVGVDCAQHPHTPLTPGKIPTCRMLLSRAPMLCNATTKDGAHECAICPDPDRACLTSTQLYCTAEGCDDAACTARR